MIKEITDIFYRHDPAGLGCLDHQLVDEYRLGAAMLYEDYKSNILQNEQVLRDCVLEILQECQFQETAFEINQNMVDELKTLLLVSA